MRSRYVRPALILSLVLAGVFADAQCTQHMAPVKLPSLSFWRVALACNERDGGPPKFEALDPVERAWRSYLDGDTLATRVELEKWTPHFVEHGSVIEFARARSLAMLATAESPGSEPRMGISLTDNLTQAWPKWKDEPALGSWVDLFDGAWEEAHQDTEAATRYWTAAAHAPDAPLRVQGLAYLGLTKLAIDFGAPNDALTDLQAADRAFSVARDVRGHAAVLILRIAATTASHDKVKSAAAAEAAESYCRTKGLLDGVVESLLAASASAAALDDQKRAAEDWRRAEDTALQSGLMPVRILTHTELLRLMQYMGTSFSLRKSREYYRWATKTGDLLLIERAAHAVAAALKRSGQIAAAGWYDVIADDASASLAQLPLSTRLLHAALIDYGLLEVGVDPGSSVEIFTGVDYESFSGQIVAMIGRAAKLDPDVDLDEVQEISMRMKTVARSTDRLRRSALDALRHNDAKTAAKQFAGFFKNLSDLLDDLSESFRQEEDQEANDAGTNLAYAAGLLNAWAMHDPSQLRTVIGSLGSDASSNPPLLLPEADFGASHGPDQASFLVGTRNFEALSRAVAQGRASNPRSWPRLVTRYAAEGGARAAAAAVLGTQTGQLNEQESVQLQIAYAGQFALAANGDIHYVQLGREHPFAWLISKMRAEPGVKEDLGKASQFGLWVWLHQTALFSSGPSAERRARNQLFQSILEEDPDLPDFDSLTEDDDSDDGNAEEEKPEDDKFVAPKGFLHEWEFTAWSISFPVLLDAVVEPQNDSVDKAVSDAMTNFTPDVSLLKVLSAGGESGSLAQIVSMQHTEMLDLALSSLVRKRYRQAIDRLSHFEMMLPPDAALDRVQTMYVEAMCYRGLRDGQREEALLKSATEELGEMRRLAATRSASLRLNDLRQLIAEEYFSVLYRGHKWTRMAGAMAEYRSASILPAAVLAAAPRHPLAQELKTLRDTYDALSQGNEYSPVTRQDYREFLELFNAPERLPYDDPMLSAIAQATYMVTNELYAQAPHAARQASAIRPAAPGELLILLAVGQSGVHTVTLDEHGRVSGYYRYILLSRLESLSNGFKSAVQGNGNFRETGAQLYDLLFAYLPEMNGKRRLSILADGPLQDLPWAALPGTHGRYLIEDYEIGILSSVSAASGGGKAGAHARVLAIANPDLQPDAEKGIAALSGIPSVNVVQLQPAQSTISDIQHALSNAEDIYISTHGLSVPLRPDYSYLVLPDGNSLYSLDLGSLDLRNRRVMLSACDTRSGQTYPGEEAYGLADAFLARNAATVVATLWPVETGPADAFSLSFYARVGAGADYTTAATQAARSLLRGQSADWSAPKHWAAYVPVTGLLDTSPKTALLVEGGEHRNEAEVVRTEGALKDDIKRAERERDNLLQNEAALKAAIRELTDQDGEEEIRDGVLSAQSKAGQSREEWLDVASKNAKAFLQNDPAWKPVEHLALTVTVKGEDGKAISGAEVVLAEDTDRSLQASQVTDAAGRTVFRNVRSGIPYKFNVLAKGFDAHSYLSRRSLEDDEGWFADAEKVINLSRSYSEALAVVAKPAPAPVKPSPEKSKAKRAVAPPQPQSAQTAQSLLASLNDQDVSNDSIRERVEKLEADRTEAQKTLDDERNYEKRIMAVLKERWTRLQAKSRDWNALLRQMHLPELRPEALAVSGTVVLPSEAPTVATVVMKTVATGAEKTTSSDKEGRFTFYGVVPGEEYTMTANSEEGASWTSLLMPFYFSAPISIHLGTHMETASGRSPF